MLNISNNKYHTKIDLEKYNSGKKIFNTEYYKQFNKFLIIFSVILVIILFLPWTQNISGYGSVTTLKPGQRPQTIQSQIPGRIEKWFVNEGDFVLKGDTILQISEIKSDYFDDQLVERTNQQLLAKSSSLVSYNNKVEALQRQIAALENEKLLKLEQAENKLIQAHLKVKIDSIDFEAAKTNISIAERQYDRIVSLQQDGLKATKDVEEKKLKLQETQAKVIAQENKLLGSKNEVLNAKVEIFSIEASYIDKISKAQSDLFSAESSTFDTSAQINKLENSYTNYKMRNSLLFITAPQSGFINTVIKGGIGVTFKEGEGIVEIMPADYELAVETFIKPIDLPLVHLNEKVRVQFDGWPAIVFSGWPNISYGTYGARIVAIENFISQNGRYRVLLAPDKDDYEWPTFLRVGSGAKTIALLDNVPIWFELWRQLNSFPPNFYKPATDYNESKK
jgi:multidrug efflux pump subunit AcrA (membrane-fusion protein)